MQPSTRSRISRFAALAAAVGVVGVVAVLLLLNMSASTSRPTADSSAPAPAPADETVRVLTGGIHTVYHSQPPLPTSDAPREDGKPTLVWFSGTWCDVCHKMEPYANSTFARFASQVTFVEKSVDHDRPAASRYGVRGTPTFVLLDARGKDVARFFYQPDADRLAQAVTRALEAPRS